MLFALTVLQEGFNTVIVQPRLVTHGSGLDFERTPARFLVEIQQGCCSNH